MACNYFCALTAFHSPSACREVSEKSVKYSISGTTDAAKELSQRRRKEFPEHFRIPGAACRLHALADKKLHRRGFPVPV
ncbi:MAG: hypothetical protein Greene041679_357, partial [Parcubacteria group bacterium Greene0416_79]